MTAPNTSDTVGLLDDALISAMGKPACVKLRHMNNGIILKIVVLCRKIIYIIRGLYVRKIKHNQNAKIYF